MKIRFTLLGLILFCLLSDLRAQNRYFLSFQSGKEEVVQNITTFDWKSKAIQNTLYKGNAYLVLVFAQVPDQVIQDRAKTQGIEFLSFLPPSAYVAKVPIGFSSASLEQLGIKAILPMDPKWKMSRELRSKVLYPAHAVAGDGDLKLNVLAQSNINQEELSRNFKELNILEIGRREDSRILSIKVNPSEIERIAALPYVEWVEPINPEEKPINQPGVNSHRAGILNSSLTGQRNLRGDGVVVGIGDGGYVRPHYDFNNNRLTNLNGSTIVSFGDHGDHVSGTVGGAGILNPFARGMAPNVSLITQQTSGILNSAYFTNYGMILTNNSYGFGIACPATGGYSTYTATSVFIDNQMRNTPKLLHCFAASNDGGTTPCGDYSGGFGTISLGYGTTKNALIVGAVSETDAIASFSSRGPTQDGRVKPEICGVGTSVLSTIPNNTYGSKNGTSMATPGLTGTLSLLYQRFKQLNGGQNPDAALIKAVACNTADDLGNANVDFKHGYGRVNALKAAQVLEANRYYSNSISQGATQDVTLTLPAGQNQLKVMLYWPDREGNSGASPCLVNNLRLQVIDPGATSYDPWILDPLPANCNNVAVRGVDNLNNIEQVMLTNPVAGNYTLRVTAPTVPFGPQLYYVVYEYLQPSVALTYPIGGEIFTSNAATNVTWNVTGLSGGNLVLEYSIDNGGNWTVINSAIALTTTRYSWTPGAGFTPSNNVLLRVRHSTTPANSSTSQPFTIAGWPTISATVCDRHAYLSWTSILGVDSFEVYHFPNEVPVLLATTTATTYTVARLTNGIEYFYAVRPVFAGFNGERSAAVKATPSAVAACPVANDVGIYSILPTSGRLLTSSSLSATQVIQSDIKNYGTSSQTGVNIPFFYTLNNGPVQSANYNGILASNGLTAIQSFPGTQNLSATGTYNLVAWTQLPGDANAKNDTIKVTIRQIPNAAVTLPVTENFEGIQNQTLRASTIGLAGTDPFDFTAQTANSRLRTTAFPSINGSGTKTVTLDRAIQSASTAYNYLIYTLNLTNHSSASRLLLNFDYVQHGEAASNTNDKVWARGTDVQAWVQVYDLFANQAIAGTVKQVRNLDIKALLGAQAIGSSFQIRFGQDGIDIAQTLIMKGGYTFDNIQVIDPGTDLAVTSITSPTGNCIASTSQTLTVQVQNTSPIVVTNVPIRYQVNGGSVVSASIASLPASSTTPYSFAPNLSLTGTNVFYIRVWVDWSGPSPVADVNRSNDTASVTVATTVNNYPYLENFDASNGGFTISGTSPSWAWGVPGASNSSIKKAVSGTKIWKTALNGYYNNSEASQIQSPCMNLSGSFSAASLPVLSFNLNGFTEADYDFLWVEYSLDGTVWTKLGAANGANSTNWYNRTANNTWHSDLTPWKVVSYVVPAAALGATTRFRLNFSADGSVVDEGVGIDNFHIVPNLKIHNTLGDLTNRTVNSNGSGNWLYFTNAAGEQIAGIKDVASMGTVSLDVRQVSGAERIFNSVLYMNRNFKITPTFTPGPAVPIRLFFLESEVNSLRASDTQVKSFTDLKANKYSGLLENLNPDDNETFSSNYSYYSSPEKVPYHNGYYAEFSISSFSEFYLAGGDMSSVEDPLPLYLSQFEAKAKPGFAELTWSFEADEAVSQFILEFSPDGKDFQPLTTLTTNGSGKNFRYSDSKRGNSVWYKLLWKDQNGKIRLAGIRKVSWVNRNPVECYPNPAGKELFLQVQDLTEIESVVLYNSIGKEWRPVIQNEGANGLKKLILPDVAPGMYSIKIQFVDSAETRKLVIEQ